MNLLDTFSPSSKADWLAKVETDLKGRPLAELKFSLADRLEMSPFYHREDALDIQLAGVAQHSTKLGISIDVVDEARSNALIIEYLKGGASYVHITSVQRDQPIDWGTLFKEVYLEMIECKVSLESQEDLASLQSYLSTNYADQLAFTMELETKEDYQFENVVYRHEDLVTNLRSFVVRADEVIQSDQNELVAHVRLTNDYLQNIASIRATKLLWQNVLLAHQASESHQLLRIQTHMEGSALSADPYQNMIRLTQMCVSAISGGADIFMIPASTIGSSEDAEGWHRRISRNIFHLMTLESHLDKVSDPAAGSYLLDQMTDQLARAAWDQALAL